MICDEKNISSKNFIQTFVLLVIYRVMFTNGKPIQRLCTGNYYINIKNIVLQGCYTTR